MVGKKAMPIGAMFAKIGEDGKWRLGDIKPAEETLSYKNDYLMEINPANGTVLRRYCYLDAYTLNKTFAKWSAADKENAVGWWDWNTATDSKTGFSPMGPRSAVKVDDERFDASQGFDTTFASAKAVLVFSGEVPAGGDTFDYTDMKAFPIINYLPRKITLGELKPAEETLSYKNDYLMKINPENGTVLARYCYLDAYTLNKTFAKWSAEDKANAVGWWDWNSVTDSKTGFSPMGPRSAVKVDDVEIEPGEGFDATFASAKAKITFPKAIPDPAPAE